MIIYNVKIHYEYSRNRGFVESFKFFLNPAYKQPPTLRKYMKKLICILLLRKLILKENDNC